MKEQILALKGLDIDGLIEVHDYYQMKFSNNSSLNLYNPCCFSFSNIKSYIGRRIELVTINYDELLFSISGGNKITMSLKDEDYQSPEAMEFMDKYGNCYVWN